jgi:DNA modification methylase
MVEKVVIGNAELWHGDCREVMAELLPRSDLVLTDPPYGVSVLLHHGRTGPRLHERYIGLLNDSSQAVGVEVLLFAESVGVPTIAFSSPMKPWPGQWDQYLVWDKGPALGGGGNTKRTWKNCFEVIQVARIDRLRLGRDSSVLKFWDSPSHGRDHITQKPVKLMMYLVMQASDPGLCIFDPFAGSGSTGVAAVTAGRRFIGVEVHRPYFDIACKRIDCAQSQGQLLPPEEPRQPVQDGVF